MKYFLLLLLLCSSFLMTAQNANAEEIVQANLDVYNTHNIELFLSFFSEDVAMYNFNDGKQTAQGIDALSAIYRPYFKTSPGLHSTILNRTVFDNKVIDHESITGARGNEEAFEIVLIYEVNNDKITKMTVVRKQ